jgi:hypothetical protein
MACAGSRLCRTGGRQAQIASFLAGCFGAGKNLVPGCLRHKDASLGLVPDWKLPACFRDLRRRLEAEHEGEGTREYIKVLRLLEKHSPRELARAVEQGLRCGASSRDAIAQFLTPRVEWRYTCLSLDGRDHLRGIQVACTDVSGYSRLLGQEVGA